MKNIRLEVTRGDDQKLVLNAKTMNELVDKIIDWQLWKNQSLDYYKKKGTLEEEKESGWYYFKQHYLQRLLYGAVICFYKLCTIKSVRWSFSNNN